MATKWLWLVREQEHGPVSFRELTLMVRERILNEDDLVREDCDREWRTADRIPGLFYMAQRVAEIRSPEVTMESAPATNFPDPSPSVPWKSLAEACDILSDSGVNRIGIDNVHTSNQRTSPQSDNELCEDHTDLQLCDEFNPVDDEMAAAIDAATEAWDSRHVSPEQGEPTSKPQPILLAALLSPLYRFVAAIEAVVGALIAFCFWIGRNIGIGALCLALERVVSRQVLTFWFRAMFSLGTVAVTVWGVTTWSYQVTVTYPNPEWIAAGKKVFPLVGPCLPSEYVFLLVDLMLVSAVVGYFTARYLESLSSD